MPHIFDFDGLEERLYVLRHLCFGSRRCCDEEKVSRTHSEDSHDAWRRYYGNLKSSVSAIAIEAAIKVRMIQDFVRANEDEDDEPKTDFDSIEATSMSGLVIGKVHKGNFSLNLRESCNKIIHATEARLRWVGDGGNGSVEYWSGGYILFGTKDTSWEVELYLDAWALAMIEFNSSIRDSIDWHRVAKWDE